MSYLPRVDKMIYTETGPDFITDMTSFDLITTLRSIVTTNVTGQHSNPGNNDSIINISENNGSLTNISFDLEDLMGPRRDSIEAVISMTLVYTIILVAGIVGNICTCVVIARNRYMHTATNYYLFSLAVSDLLLLVLGLPQELYQLWDKYPYIFGEVFCVLRGWTSETSTNASILTITAFTVERYLAICHPLRAHTMSRLSRAIKFIVVIWICGALCAIPMAYQLGIYHEPDPTGEPVLETATCGIKRHLSHAFEISTAIFFILPASLLSVLYILIAIQLRSSAEVGSKHHGQKAKHSATNGVKGQVKTLNALTRQTGRGSKGSTSSRKAVVKMLVAVVVAFFLCWAPFHGQRLMAIYVTDPTPADIATFTVLTYISGITYYVSATINPILYSIMSLKFRHAFRDTLSRCLGHRSARRERARTISRYNSTLRSAGYEITDLTLISESPQNAEDETVQANGHGGGSGNLFGTRGSKGRLDQLGISAGRRMTTCDAQDQERDPREGKKASSSISNSSLQMLDEDAFDGVDISDYVEKMKDNRG